MKKHWAFPAISLLLLLLTNTAVVAQSGPREQAEYLFVEAQKALSRGDGELAESLLKEALQKDASFTSAIWQLAQIFEEKGKLEYARELILRGLQQDPGATWARDKLSQLETVLVRQLLSEAEDYMVAGKYDLAIPKLSLSHSIKPRDQNPLIMLGRCHLAQRSFQVAKEYLIKAIEIDPSNDEVAMLLNEVDERIAHTSNDALFRRARTLLANYSPETRHKVREALEAILEVEPGNVWAHEKLKELDLLTAREERTEKNQVTDRVVEKGVSVWHHMKEAFQKIMNFITEHLFVIILATASILLAIDIKRKVERKSYPLQGSLNIIPILDVVSLLNSNLKTGRLVVSSSVGRGEIFLQKGEVVHARWKDIDGKKAFHKLMELRSGNYFFSNHLPNVRHTITEPLSLLLLSLRMNEQNVVARKKRTKQKEKEELTTPSPH